MRIDPQAWPVTLASLAAALLAGWWQPWLALPPLAFSLFAVWFFRDPTRDPQRYRPDAGSMLAPADGRVIEAGPRRLSIFMNVFNVHICRTPAAGEVVRVDHVSGKFLSAFKPEAPEQNERTTIEIAGGNPVTFVLVAGLVARRIVPRVRPGDRLAAGDRVGLIRFGSRVDIELDEGSHAAVKIGDRVVAGETIVVRRSGVGGA